MQWRALLSILSRRRISIGIELGTSQMKIVSIAKQRNTLSLLDAWKTSIPLEVRSHPDQRHAFMCQTLRQYLRTAQVPFMAEVGLSISAPEVMAGLLSISAGTPAEMREGIRMELQQRLSYPVEEAIWKFSFPQEKGESPEGRVNVFVVAAPAAWIQELVSIFGSLRLVLVRMTTPPYALFDFLTQTPFFPRTQGLALLEIGFTTSTLMFFTKELEFLRTIPLGSDHFSLGLLRTMTTAQGPHAITAQEAEQILRTYGMSSEEPSEPVAGLTQGQVYSILRPNLENMFLEVQRTLTYYRQTYKRPPPERILVLGGGACIPNLMEFLKANVDESSVEKTDPFQLLRGWKGPSPELQTAVGESSAQFAVSLGAAPIQRSFKGAGGVPTLYQYNYSFSLAFLAARWVAILGALITLAFSLSFYWDRIHCERLSREAKTQISGLLPRVSQIQEYNQLKGTLVQQETLLGQAIGRRPLWVGVIEELSRITPEPIRLTSIETEENSVPIQIRLQGEILPSYTSVEVLYSQYQLALEQSPFFAEVELITMKKDVYSPTPRAVFEIRCRVVY